MSELKPKWTGVCTIYIVPGWWLRMVKEKEIFSDAAKEHGVQAWWNSDTTLMLWAPSHEHIAEAKEAVEDLADRVYEASMLRATMELLA